MPLNPDGFGQELIKKPSLDLHAVAERDLRPAQGEGGEREMRWKRRGEGGGCVCSERRKSAAARREDGGGMRRGGVGDSSRTGTRGL